MAYSLYTPDPAREHSIRFAGVAAEQWHNGPSDYIAFLAGCARIALGALRCEYTCEPSPNDTFTLTARIAL